MSFITLSACAGAAVKRALALSPQKPKKRVAAAQRGAESLAASWRAIGDAQAARRPTGGAARPEPPCLPAAVTPMDGAVGTGGGAQQ